MELGAIRTWLEPNESYLFVGTITGFILIIMMTSSNGTIFRVTGPLCGEFIHWNGKVVRMTALVFTGDVEDKLQRLQWIPRLSLWRPFRFCVGTGEFPAQRPITRGFDVFFDLRLNKRLNKQPWGWWFQTPPWSLWRHCNDTDATRVHCFSN